MCHFDKLVFTIKLCKAQKPISFIFLHTYVRLFMPKIASMDCFPCYKIKITRQDSHGFHFQRAGILANQHPIFSLHSQSFCQTLKIIIYVQCRWLDFIQYYWHWNKEFLHQLLVLAVYSGLSLCNAGVLLYSVTNFLINTVIEPLTGSLCSFCPLVVLWSYKNRSKHLSCGSCACRFWRQDFWPLNTIEVNGFHLH